MRGIQIFVILSTGREFESWKARSMHRKWYENTGSRAGKPTKNNTCKN